MSVIKIVPIWYMSLEDACANQSKITFYSALQPERSLRRWLVESSTKGNFSEFPGIAGNNAIPHLAARNHFNPLVKKVEIDISNYYQFEFWDIKIDVDLRYIAEFELQRNSKSFNLVFIQFHAQP